MNKDRDFSFDDDIIHTKDSPSELARVTEILLNEQWGRRKTNLHDRLVSAISTLDTLSQIYKIQFLQTWIPSYCEYLTSVGGKGRQDIVDITKYRIDQDREKYNDMLGLMGKK